MCLNVQPSKHRCSAKPRKKLDAAKLMSATIQLAEQLNTIFEEDIEPAPNADTEWARPRDPLYGAAHEILDVTQRKHIYWFDENDTEATNILDNMHTSRMDKRQEFAIEGNILSPQQAARTGQATFCEGGLVV